MEYRVTATVPMSNGALAIGKALTAGVIEAATPEAAIAVVRRKYVRQGEKYGPVDAITFEAQEAPADEDECC